MIEIIAIGFMAIFTILFVIQEVNDLVETIAYRKGFTDIKVYEFQMEFVTMDNKALVHKSGVICMEGHSPMWDSVRNEYFYADGVAYPKHAVKSIRVLPCNYAEVRVSNKIMERDRYHDEPYFTSCTWVDINRLVENKQVEVLKKMKV